MNRFSYLDSARGLAALSVAIWHFFTAFADYRQPGLISTSPFHLFWYGEAAVVFFFIHSGFILSYSYTSSSQKITIAGYARFLIERIFRIYPLFLFILFISFILKNSIFPLINQKIYATEHIHLFWSRKYTLTTVLKESTLFIRIPNAIGLRLIPQDWSLSVEIVVGALIPLLALLWKKVKGLFYWIIVILAIRLAHLNIYIFEFGAGVFIFYNWEKIRKTWSELNIYFKVLLIVLSLFFYSCLFYFGSLFNNDRVLISSTADRMLVIIGCSILFCVLISSPFAQKIFSFVPLVRVGRTCYSIYLIHMMLLICFADYFMQRLHIWFDLPSSAYLWISFVIYILITIGLSFISFALIEKPLNVLGKRIGKEVELFIKINLERFTVVKTNSR